MRHRGKRLMALILALAMLVSLDACGKGENTAATMRLKRAEGTVWLSVGRKAGALAGG